MEEKIICTSKKLNLKPTKKRIKIVALLIFLLSAIISGIVSLVEAKHTVFGYAYFDFDFGDFIGGIFGLFLVIALALCLIWSIVYYFLNNYEMTITDKRIYGKIRFGNQIDLPLDSISAATKISFMYGICVASSSGKIKFYGIKNLDEMYSAICNQLLERQNNKNHVVTYPASTPENNTNTPENLLKLKELLDQGIINQEEFDTKKKQILGL